jgi:hypothetical protein
VLASVHKHKDATIGISWTTISVHLGECESIPPRPERAPWPLVRASV